MHDVLLVVWAFRLHIIVVAGVLGCVAHCERKPRY